MVFLYKIKNVIIVKKLRVVIENLQNDIFIIYIFY